MVAGLETRKFTADEFHRMLEVGILDEDDRLELIDGQIVHMAPIGNPHALAVDRLNRLLVLALQQSKLLVRIQNHVLLTPNTEVYPDVSVVRDLGNEFLRRPPGPDDVALIIEVSDSTLRYDRETKALLYARAGIAELWVVNIGAGVVELYRNPSLDGYRDASKASGKDTVRPVALPGVELPVSDFLPEQA